MGMGALCAIAIATPKHLRWFWALHFPNKPENLRTDNRVETLEAAKAEFEASWRDWKAWAKLEESGR
jgi:hypothetical protein